MAAHGAAEAPRGPAPQAGRVRAVRRGIALPGLRARADQDRRRAERATGIRPIVALHHRPRAIPLRLPVLSGARRPRGQAAAADREGAPRPGSPGPDDHEQVFRPPAALPARGHLRPPRRGAVAGHALRLDGPKRRAARAALRLDGQAGLAVHRRPHRRHHRAGPGPEAPRDAHRTILGLCRGRPQPLRRLRLHPAADPGRSGAVPQWVPGLPPGRRVLRLRPDAAPART